MKRWIINSTKVLQMVSKEFLGVEGEKRTVRGICGKTLTCSGLWLILICHCQVPGEAASSCYRSSCHLQSLACKFSCGCLVCIQTSAKMYYDIPGWINCMYKCLIYIFIVPLGSCRFACWTEGSALCHMCCSSRSRDTAVHLPRYHHLHWDRNPLSACHG